MSQQFSLTQSAHSVRQVLTAYTSLTWIRAESLNRPLGIPDMALEGGGGVLAQDVLS
jgi:hypothetical protein